MRARTWICTLNNPTTLWETLYNDQRDRIKYMGGQLEQGENGTSHYQFVVQFKDAQGLSLFKKWDSKIHAEVAHHPEQAISYCHKEEGRLAELRTFGVYVDSGRKPVKPLVAELAKKSVLELAEQLDPITYNATIKAISHYNVHKKVNMDVNTDMKPKGIWLVGKPGVGKSYAVRSKWGDKLFLKSQNKWWDGYNGQDYVLLDDFDKQGSCLSHYLKIWADAYVFSGEVKGATLPLDYKYFIITSNYIPGEIFSEDTELLLAIERRFTIINVDIYNRDTCLSNFS